MSLINDALKEAQRERSGRNAQDAPQLVASLFPLPEEEKRRPGTLFISATLVAVVAAVVAAIVIVGGPALVLERRAPTVPTYAPSVTQSGRVTPMPAATPIVAAPAAPVSAPATLAKPVTAGIDPPPAMPARATQPVALLSRLVAKSPPKPTLADNTGIDTSPPPAATLTPAVAFAPLAAPRPTPAVRRVLDGTGTSRADSLSRLAYVEQMKSNVDAARGLYERAIASKNAPAEAFNNYGVLLEQLGDSAMAGEMFRQAIVRDDSNVEAWVNLGDSYAATGHHAAALSAFDRARQLDPTRAAVKIRLASEYMEIGDTTGARRTLEEAVRVSPRDPRAHYAYGSLLQLTDDYRGAIREFDLFVEHVDRAPGEFTPEKITEVRRHIVALRRVAP